jgi:hypothetical protein
LSDDWWRQAIRCDVVYRFVGSHLDLPLQQSERMIERERGWLRG